MCELLRDTLVALNAELDEGPMATLKALADAYEERGDTVLAVGRWLNLK